MADKYTKGDFAFKIDYTGYQILFRGVPFQSTRVNWDKTVDLDALATGIAGSIERMVDQLEDEVLDWQLHWDDVASREV
jgi:hypothetical protein